MGHGVIYKCIDGKRWEKTVVKDTGNTSDVFDDGKVRHCDDGSKWYDNYPMEKYYEQYFNAWWTQGYKGNGDKLTNKDFGDHPRAGDTTGYIGMWGFNNEALKDFVADGIVTSMKIEVMYDDPTDNKTPTITFGCFNNKTEPNRADAEFIFSNPEYTVDKTFTKTDADYKTWITLPVACWLNGEFGGVACWGKTNTSANYARFAGEHTSHSLNAFNTRLFLKVFK